MQSLNDKIVLITGASSGIGKACAKQFASAGAKLILAARRVEKLQQLAADMKREFDTICLPLTLDVSDKQQVADAFQQLHAEWQSIDVLVNNAGLARASDPIQEGKLDDWDTMINTNIHGFLYVIHAVLPNMVARNRGHIVNIGSISGRDVYPNGNIYCATKHAVAAINKALRLDLLGKNIRVTEIAPGLVATEFSTVRWQDPERAADFYAEFEPLQAEDIADAIIYATTRPAHVDVSEIVIYPTCQASVNHLAKK